MPKIVYQPKGYSIGDAMPFFEDGVFYIYHYKTRIGETNPAANWTLSETRDFVTWYDCGELFKHGAEGEQDFIFRSGTVFKKDGIYHFFYGGDNNGEVILHASGEKIGGLKKDDFRLAPFNGYSTKEWRDPFVFFAKKINSYVMILGTRKNTGKYVNGATVWFVSQNLTDWEFKGDFWAPNQYTTHEMPDVFKLGGFWYLLVSEYSDSTQVIYRRSRNFSGPWELCADGVLDGAMYFAGRTWDCGNGKRFLSGWISGKAGDTDRGAVGGTSGLYVHEVFQKKDGTLGCALPKSVQKAFSDELSVQTTDMRIEEKYGRTQGLLAECGNDCFLLSLKIKAENGTGAFSVNILEDEKSGAAYEYRFLPEWGEVIFSETPNHGIEPPDHFRGMEKVRRNIKADTEDSFEIQILRDDSYCVLYVNGYALSARLYNSKGSGISAAVFNGSIHVKGVKLWGFHKSLS